ncbi:hypothetical protein [Ensifer adhaerens]|uniref:hypothetical protein n=1 Tax=Ensifer adhaerens TaxID=106592 RepID=UPI0038505659
MKADATFAFTPRPEHLHRRSRTLRWTEPLSSAYLGGLGARMPNQGDDRVSTDKQPETTVKVEKRINGKWCFVIKFRGVTYPAQGNFTSMLEAQAAAQSVLNGLEKRG